MKLLDRYILSEAVGSFLFGMAIFTALLMAGDLLGDAIQLLVNTKVPLSLVVEIIILRLPSVVVLTIPMATLLAMLLSFSRLSTQQEINAIRAGGVSFARVMVPVLALGLLATGLTLALEEGIAPPANVVADQILITVGEKAAEGAHGILLRDPMKGELKRIIFAQSYSRKTQTFVRPDVYEYDRGRPVALVSADKATWTGRTWEFTNGFFQTIGRSLGYTVDHWQRFYRDLGKDPDAVTREIRKLNPENMTFGELKMYLEDLRRAPGFEQVRREALVELHNKIAIPFSCFVFALVGAPLGLQRPRSSSSIGVGMSIVVIFMYYVVWWYSRLVAENGHLSPALAGWSGNIVTAVVGLLLVVRASR